MFALIVTVLIIGLFFSSRIFRGIVGLILWCAIAAGFYGAYNYAEVPPVVQSDR